MMIHAEWRVSRKLNIESNRFTEMRNFYYMSVVVYKIYWHRVECLMNRTNANVHRNWLFIDHCTQSTRMPMIVEHAKENSIEKIVDLVRTRLFEILELFRSFEIISIAENRINIFSN